MIERERKFMTGKGMKIFSDIPEQTLITGYFTINSDRYVRVRRVDAWPDISYSLSLKVVRTPSERMEITKGLTTEEFLEIYQQCRSFLKKTRKELVIDGVEYSYDKYFRGEEVTGEFIEAELLPGTENFPEVFPEFCGVEVTGIPECTNIAFTSDVPVKLQ